MNLISEMWRPTLCLALFLRARAHTHTYTHTHTHTHTPPPKFRFSARGGWGRGGSKGCADNGERKSECQGLRVYLARGPRRALEGPSPGAGPPPLPAVLWSRLEVLLIPLSSFSYLVLCARPTPFLRAPPTTTTTSGLEGTSDFFLHRVGVIHIKHFTTTHQEK